MFIPTAFITGISGAFYKQFALTIATATMISCFISLTLSPALAALLLRTHSHEPPKPGFWTTAGRPINAFFAGFNRGFDKLSQGYGGLTRRAIRVSVLMLVVYAGLIGLTDFQFSPHAVRLRAAARPRLFHHRGHLAAGREPGAHRCRDPQGQRHPAVAARASPTP